jgi:enoyl-CoA hydratase/carnithine racemase/predicted GIY-YIG superfamily endonuclease
MRFYYVYILASHKRVLYTGITSDLDRRSWEHQREQDPDSFSARYRVNKLVYFERYGRVQHAITREKEIKGWRREKKIALIEANNPKWKDLSAGWGKPYRQWPPASVVDTSRQIPRAPTDGALGMTRRGKKPSDPRRTSVEEIAQKEAVILRLDSPDGMNRLTFECVLQLTRRIEHWLRHPKPLIITGNTHFFSAGADLNEIAALSGPDAYAFSRAGQQLMDLIDDLPALTIAAISGYCLGGGLDMALACDIRIAAPNAIFGHRGASLGLITGWGGTQRLPRLVGKGRALQMFCAAEKIDAHTALEIGLINQIADNPVTAATGTQNSKIKIQN